MIGNLKNRSYPIVSVVSGSGQVTKSAVLSGADMIIALNAGLYRNMGFGSLAAFMPYGNANDQTEKLLLQHILPHRKDTPVIAGVFASDPTTSIRKRLVRLKELGIEGITNWPAVGFIDGEIRKAMEEDGLGVQAEVALLEIAKELGFMTFGFALSAEDAFIFAESGVDALILNVGLTFEIEDTIEKRNQLQLSITKAKKMLAEVQRSDQHPICLIYGGSLTEPADFEEFLLQLPIHGYAGGSVFDRFPVLESVVLKVKSFKLIDVHQQKRNAPQFGNLVGSTPVMKALYERIEKVAPYDVNVCIDGESGTGKELVANQIHLLSPRKGHPFITVNCGAIPDTLVESEFFGYEKGAFTGANFRKQGKFELAHRGTLFLDEVADLSPHAQAALLRVIQQGEVVTLGGQKVTPVDVRLLCASNQNLEQLVEMGKFREDLYFRLSTIILKLPPLRERRNDIPSLVEYIRSKLAVRFNKKIQGITDGFMEKLMTHSWKGNVRELEQVITRQVLMEDQPILEGKNFQPSSSTNRSIEMEVPKSERALMAIREADGNKTKAAASLGISRKTLYIWLKETSI
ncbi:phosphoenolpyruvate hydrolase family protein [Pleomorphovibrio marinus]|uniref:phosphoenolpyruvate hydrolase family protein n=1 Tax=Pleomorphovibrio marinus TaxID=2164132 RepID=UPI000E0A3444|nr:phosphoenolpyruvate hydrolase family protein [Pleomorphovibrio marinus]